MSENKKSISRISIIVPVVLCVAYAVLCMLNLRGPIWHHEAYSAYIIRGSFSDIWEIATQNSHCPIFYFLLKIWAGIFGYNDVSLRFLSIFCGALTIIFLFHLLKKWFSLKTAIIVSALFSISPVFIRLGQEISAFNLGCLIVVLVVYLLDSIFEMRRKKNLQSDPVSTTEKKIPARSIRICLLILTGAAMTIFGIINLHSHAPNSEIKEIVLETEILNVNSEPVLINNAWNFYDAVFYANERRPIYGIAQNINHDERDFVPIYKINYHLIADLVDFVDSHEKFWYLTDYDENANSITDYNLPEEFNNYRVVSDLIQDKFAVFELEKTEE